MCTLTFEQETDSHRQVDYKELVQPGSRPDAIIAVFPFSDPERLDTLLAVQGYCILIWNCVLP